MTTMFSTYQRKKSLFFTKIEFIVSKINAFNLDKAKILLFGKELLGQILLLKG